MFTFKPEEYAETVTLLPEVLPPRIFPGGVFPVTGTADDPGKLLEAGRSEGDGFKHGFHGEPEAESLEFEEFRDAGIGVGLGGDGSAEEAMLEAFSIEVVP